MIGLRIGLSAVVLSCWLVDGARGQQPAPLAESRELASPEEAAMCHFVRGLVSQLRAGQAQRLLGRPAWASSYAPMLARRDEQGGWSMQIDWPGPQQGLRYFVPLASEMPRIVFCVRDDGAVAFTRNEQRTSWVEGLDLPAGNSVLGAGGRDGDSDFPLTPSRGNDGNMWMPLSMLPTAKLRVRVVDESGEPAEGLEVQCLPPPAGFVGDPLDRVLPGGAVTLDADGEGTIAGLPARGLSLVVRLGAVEVPVAGSDLQFDGDRATIRVELAEIQRQAWAANESAAIATLKNVSSAQAQCQAASVIDADRDGAGEHGTFGELSGAIAVRGGDESITPPVLSAAFGHVAGGVVQRSGYCFRMVLPGQGGAPIAENPNGGAKDLAIDPDLAEKYWCVHAWPIVAGRSGQRAFLIDQSGDVRAFANDGGLYSGVSRAPAMDAGSLRAGRIDAGFAANGVGVDGHRWNVIR